MARPGASGPASRAHRWLLSARHCCQHHSRSCSPRRTSQSSCGVRWLPVASRESSSLAATESASRALSRLLLSIRTCSRVSGGDGDNRGFCLRGGATTHGAAPRPFWGAAQNDATQGSPGRSVPIQSLKGTRMTDSGSCNLDSNHSRPDMKALTPCEADGCRVTALTHHQVLLDMNGAAQ